MSIGEVVRKQSLVVQSLNRGKGNTESGTMVFEAVLLTLLEFFGAEWSRFQIREVAELMHGSYGYWSVAELKYFTVKIKTGEYGKMYGKFSPAHLTGYAAEYNYELLKERAAFHNRKQEPEVDSEKEEREYVSAERMSAVFSRFIAEWNANINEQEKVAEMEREARKKHYKAKRRALIKTNCEKLGIDFEKIEREYEL